MGLYVNPEDRAIAARLARNDLYTYARYMMRETLGVKWLRAAHHKIIFDALTDVFEGRVNRLIINVPPRYSKTISVLSFVTWALGHAPDSHFIFTSYNGKLAATNAWGARETVRHPVYRDIFPGVFLDNSSSAKDEWRTAAGGIVYSAGEGGGITGYGAGRMREGFGGCIIIDDILKADEARSEVIRNGGIDWYQNTLQSRCNDRRTPIIVIGQRLHEEDLPGWLIAGGTGEHWHTVVLPAITEAGEALWPEKHTLADLRRLEMASPMVFAGQYLQRPAPPGGALFKPDMMPVAEGAGTAVIERVRGWDLASSQDRGDWTVGALLGRTANDRFIIEDIRRLQGAPEVVEAAIVAQTKIDGHGVKVALPKDPGQAGAFQVLYLTKKLAGFRVVSSPESGDKVGRAEPFAAQVNVGNVDMVRADWNQAFVNEARNFPFAKNDDQVDAASRAFMELTSKPRSFVVTEKLLQRGGVPPRRLF